MGGGGGQVESTLVSIGYRTISIDDHPFVSLFVSMSQRSQSLSQMD